MRESNFPDQLIESVFGLEAAGFDVAEVIENILARCLLLFRKVGHCSIWIGGDNFSAGEDAILSLKLL